MVPINSLPQHTHRKRAPFAIIAYTQDFYISGQNSHARKWAWPHNGSYDDFITKLMVSIDPLTQKTQEKSPYLSQQLTHRIFKICVQVSHEPMHSKKGVALNGSCGGFMIKQMASNDSLAQKTQEKSPYLLQQHTLRNFKFCVQISHTQKRVWP